jgi:CHAD domain-containing protein
MVKAKKTFLSAKELLQRDFEGYRKRIESTRKNPARGSIHKLRTQIQRLLATLEIISVLKRDPAIRTLCKELKKVKKNTSDLRDVQVELKLLAKKPNIKLRDLQIHLSRRKQSLAESVKGCLRNVPLSSQAQNIQWLLKNLESPDESRNTSSLVNTTNDYVRQSVVSINKLFPPNKKLKTKGLHRFRGKLKRLRYLTEFQFQLSGKTAINLKQVKIAQDQLGEIQNDQALITNIYSFEKLFPQGRTKFLKVYRKQIQLDKKHRIQQFNSFARHEVES